MRFMFRRAPQPPPEPLQPPQVQTLDPPPLSTRRDAPGGDKANPTVCPECGGKGLVKSTRQAVQYRKCKDCDHKYQTEKKF